MFECRRAVVAGAVVCLLAGSAFVPSGVAAREPHQHGFPTGVRGLETGVDGLPTLPDAVGDPIVVTTLVDTTANDGACSLREAITAANTNAAGPDTTGRCQAGAIDEVDLVTFAIGGTILLGTELPAVTDAISINASAAPAPVVIDGGSTHRPFTVAVAGSLELTGLTVTNGATTGSGGAFEVGGALLLDSVSVTSSTADGSGGAISGLADSLVFLNLTRITGNAAAGSGGGIASDGTVLVLDCVIAGNAAVGDGGGVAMTDSGELVVAYATISGNDASGPGAGGGGVSTAGITTIANSTVAGNSADVGGGIADTGDLELDAATVTGNAAGTGSGLFSTGSPILFSALVLGNLGSPSDLSGTPDVMSAHNLTALPIGVTLAQVLDPGGLADNGGLTQTVALVRDAANPAWGGGDPELCLDYYVDQREYARSTPCDIGAYEIDDQAPTLTAPVISVVANGVLSGASIAGKVTWSGVDEASGISAYEAEISTNGAPYVPLALAPLATVAVPKLVNGSTYKVHVRAVDHDGNRSAWAISPVVTARLLQQPSAGITYSSGWKTETKAAFSGGSAKYAKAAGAWVKLVATGRTFSFVTTKALSRGRAKVYVDGAYAATLDLGAATTTYRVQAWTKTFTTSKTHTIKIVLLGTSGRPRIDADAFIVLK